MKIQGIEAIAVEIPLRTNFGGSTYAVTKRCTVITRARTDDGAATERFDDTRGKLDRRVHESHGDCVPRSAALRGELP